ncbi:Protein of unknown function [Acetitomaculum ruminis DSM 5522]|uniref:DUF3048 domain-containing protein n=1 Tax=Acetitomaculum ruminis DSM 5522 TaxID=1120918 RepID=A0A1I0V500_9FIRM|nr:DUF3048 domain-containing protein [Acetitomaculum ruminis]SFA71127.1 Protein of unknown function [Acetitomaculum ruminis DSM 5522]
MRKLLMLMCVTALGASMLFGCGKNEEKEKVTSTKKVEKVEEEPVKVEETKEGMARSYLTGEWVDEKLMETRPVAVMLNNIKQGCPQSGIANAGVVYEAPVEGGITRLMGIFEDYEGLDKIGSIRSCRTYYLYYALEFDAIYVHCGQAKFALDLLGQDFVNDLDSLKAEASTVFFKTTDRVAPHNTYASGASILAGIDYKNYDRSFSKDYEGHYLFNKDDEKDIELTNGEDAVIVKPGYVNNFPYFEYNADEGLYYRYQFDDKQIDERTNEQLKVKNILFQYSGISYYDNTQYLNIDTTSGGAGKYITDGKAIDITWKKDSEYGVTHYYNEDGEEIQLNQGKTWVCIIDKDALSRVEIAAAAS